jgi:hypothetical protein
MLGLHVGGERMKVILREILMKNLNLISVATLIVAVFTFLASTTSLFKPTIPIQFGFLVNDKIAQQIDLSTGDKAKAILLRFQNSEKTTLVGVTLDIRFYRPLALSGTEHAIKFIQGETTIEEQALALVAGRGETSKDRGWVVIEGNTSPKGWTGQGELFYRGPGPDNSYYKIRPPEFIMIGKEPIDLRVELDTQNLIAGKKYQVDVTTYSTQPGYKMKEASLFISMK